MLEDASPSRGCSDLAVLVAFPEVVALGWKRVIGTFDAIGILHTGRRDIGLEHSPCKGCSTSSRNLLVVFVVVLTYSLSQKWKDATLAPS